MKRYSLTEIAIINLFLFLCVTALQAQTDTTAIKLMNALKAVDKTNSLLLVKDVIDVDYRFENNLTLLYLASSKGFTEVCQILIEKGAKLDLQTIGGVTALTVASMLGYKDVVKLLLNKGAKIDIQAIDGATALITASMVGCSEVVKLLLDKGANKELKTNDGKTAFDYAKNDDIKRLLSGSTSKQATDEDLLKMMYDPKSAQEHYISGSKKFKENDKLGALADLTIATMENPKLSQAWLLLGRTTVDIGGNLDEALDSFDKAIETNPQSSDAYYYRGKAFATSRENEKALADLNKAIKINPKLTDAFFYRGIVFASLKEYEKAISDFSRTILMNPNNKKAYTFRGLLFDMTNNPLKACSDWKVAAKLGDTDAMEYLNKNCGNDYIGHICEISTYPSSIMTGDCPIGAFCELSLKEFGNIVFKISDTDAAKYGLIEKPERFTDPGSGNIIIAPNNNNPAKILGKGWKVRITAKECSSSDSKLYMLVSSCKRIIQTPPNQK